MRNFIGTLILISLFSCSDSYQDEIEAHREKYKKDFLSDDRSPIQNKEDLKYIQFFAPDELYKVNCEFTKAENAVPFDLATMNGKTKKYVEYGSISFTLQNQPLRLKLYQGLALMEVPEYKDLLFLPFTDKTNGNESYINGRYLEYKIGDINNGKIIVDFNKAYNPYCAFSDGYSCPKPPEENNLNIEIRAGEKKFLKASH